MKRGGVTGGHMLHLSCADKGNLSQDGRSFQRVKVDEKSYDGARLAAGWPSAKENAQPTRGRPSVYLCLAALGGSGCRPRSRNGGGA
jgi:hypothetical protein